MSIYQEVSPFSPTYLYIKQHSITGLLYFGKTIQNPEKYHGSGEYWLSHIKKHGGRKFIKTLWYCLFYDRETIKEFALMCSEQWNIVSAKDEFSNKIWANLMNENGLNGVTLSGENNGMFGKYHSEESKALMSTYDKSGKNNPMFGKLGTNNPNYGRKNTEESKKKNSLAQLGIPQGPQEKVICPHCYKIGGIGNMKRWHFDNCKFKI